MKENCNSMHSCQGECPNGICPLDNDETSFGKDRSISRNRHHAQFRDKKTSACIKAYYTAKKAVAKRKKKREIRRQYRRNF